jgi:endonuclease III
MTSVSRTAQFAKVHKVLKKCYKASPCNSGRTVVEHMLFACCLEDAHHDAAEEGFAALVHTFFDWNEVRVTSISELSEVMACLPDPRAAANRIKRVLHAVFEAMFNFDLESLRKKNLGPTVKWLEKLDGTTNFTVAYVVQAALGGHAIPIDAGTMTVLRVLDLVTDKDVVAGAVPGLERAMAKAKGIEFGSLLHELGADYSANAYSPSIRDILLQIAPECESRLPKRRADRPARKTHEPPAQPDKPGKSSGAASPSAEAKPKASASTEKPAARKKPVDAGSPSTPPISAPSKKKPATPHEPPAKPAAAEKSLPRTTAPKKRPASEGLSKRKPR